MSLSTLRWSMNVLRAIDQGRLSGAGLETEPPLPGAPPEGPALRESRLGQISLKRRAGASSQAGSATKHPSR